MRYLFYFILLVTGCRDNNPALLEKFAKAQTPQEEVDRAIKLHEELHGYTVRLFDSNGLALNPSSIQNFTNVQSVELELDGRKVRRKVTHPQTLQWLLGE